MYIGNVVAEKIQFETHHVNLFFALSFFPKCAGNMGIFPWHVSGIKRVNTHFVRSGLIFDQLYYCSRIIQYFFNISVMCIQHDLQ